MNSIKDVLHAYGWRPDGILLAHWMNWFGDQHYHPMTKYVSSDPGTISRQLEVMRVNGVGGVIVTWQGNTNTVGRAATLEMAKQCIEEGMLFCLLADPWLMNNQPNGENLVISQLTNADGQSLLASPAYLPEKYFLDFTNNLFDNNKVVAALQKQCPGFNILKRHVGYSWPEITNTIPTLKADNFNPNMKIPGLYYKFFDGGNPNKAAQFVDPNRGDGNGIDYNTVDFGSGNSRMIEDQGGNTFFDCLANTPLQSKYLALVTWNDYNERTVWEPFCSMFAGERIY